MTHCFFVSDLHGHTDWYEKLFRLISDEKPHAVFIGGDIMPSALMLKQSITDAYTDFVEGFLTHSFLKLRESLGKSYPRIFLILGNDDGKFIEPEILQWEAKGIWEYIHFKKVVLGEFNVYGYAYVPPTPFRMKDWEKYDVSRYVDPGCISPEEGFHTIEVQQNGIKYSTIKNDIETLTNNDDVSKSIFLFHSPPYRTNIDVAPLAGKSIDNVPLDVNVGSIAMKQFIEKKQPLITLHGHIHESSTITGSWKDKIGKTFCFSAAYEGKELALVRFNPEEPEKAERELV
jgi:Icc-related predicted phosphoesterase